MDVKKKYTSIPKDPFRMRMVLPSQKKIKTATKIGKELVWVRKGRYM